MRDVQAESLYNIRALGEIFNLVLVDIMSKEGALIHEALNLIICFKNFVSLHCRILLKKLICDLRFGVIVIESDQIIANIVNNMNGTRIDVHYNIVSVQFVLMNHGTNILS